MDEEPLTALEKDIRTVDKNIKSLTKKAEEIERDIADTSDPEGIKALRQRLDVIDQKEILLCEKENILLRERANLRGQVDKDGLKRLVEEAVTAQVYKRRKTAYTDCAPVTETGDVALWGGK